jgi:hypothetical protein
MMVELIRAELATARAERMRAGKQEMEIAREDRGERAQSARGFD